MKVKWNKIKEGTLLLITWDDVISDPSWLNDAKAQNYRPMGCRDIGWLINDDKLNVRISHSINADGDKSITVIPKGVIRNVKIIKYDRR